MKETRKGSGYITEYAVRVTAGVVFIAVILFYTVSAFTFPTLYILATYEDLPGEWTQVFFFAAALIISLGIAGRRHPYRLFFMVLALACFYVVGEEISWGQRLLSFASPDFFQQHNLQQEVNLHNFLTGPVGTWQKRIIEISLAVGLVGYGLLYPLLQQSNRGARWLAARGLPVPPLYLSPFFITAALCEVRLFSFNEAEVAELLIAMALAFLALRYCLYPTGAPRNDCAPRKLVSAMIVVVFLSTAGAGAVSWYSWKSPQLQSKMDQRITAGKKKFAQRYSRYGHWQHAADLYESVLVKQPRNTHVMRSLAASYRQLNDEKKCTAVTSRAVRLDMIRYSRAPRRISVNLSLFKSFQQLGNDDKAAFHLTQAIRESRDKVLLEPYNAGSFYWLGKTLQAQGDPVAAGKEFARAISMQPASKRYQRAFAKNRQYQAENKKEPAQGHQPLAMSFM